MTINSILFVFDMRVVRVLCVWWCHRANSSIQFHGTLLMLVWCSPACSAVKHKFDTSRRAQIINKQSAFECLLSIVKYLCILNKISNGECVNQ